MYKVSLSTFFSKKVNEFKIMNTLYPIFLNLRGKKCLVVGGGEVAERKVNSLIECNADVTVISPVANEKIAELFKKNKIVYEKRTYQTGDLDGFFLVIGATDSKKINESISREAEDLKILCNIVDIPELCSFFVPSVVNSGDLKIAISTNGKSPALAKKIRKELENIYGSEYAVFLDYMGKIREKLLKSNISEKDRKKILQNIINSDALNYLKSGDEEKFRKEIEKWNIF